MTELFLDPMETHHTLVSLRQTAWQRNLEKQKTQQRLTKDKCAVGLLERAVTVGTVVKAEWQGLSFLSFLGGGSHV